MAQPLDFTPSLLDRSFEEMRATIMRDLARELAQAFPGVRVAPLPIAYRFDDCHGGEHASLSPAAQALLLYMATVADRYLFPCDAGVMFPGPLFELQKGDKGLIVVELFRCQEFSIHMTWLRGASAATLRSALVAEGVE